MSGCNVESKDDPALGVKMDSWPGVLDDGRYEGSGTMEASYTIEVGSAEKVNVPWASGMRKFPVPGAG